MPNRSLVGSKKKIREAQRVEAMNHRLNRLREMAREIPSEDILDAILRDTYDDTMRAEVKKLLEPFCRFRYRRILLAGTEGATAPEKATNRMVVQ